MREIDFAALLCSRLCHDLVSPVGAMANGIEILTEEEDPAMRGQVMELLAHSLRQTSARLGFFRLAFGAAGGLGEALDSEEVHRALDSLLTTGRVSLDWRLEATALDKSLVKLLLNVALVASEALLRGGFLSVAADRADLVIIAEGTRFLLPEATQKALSGALEEAAVDPRTAPAFLAGQLAKGLDVPVRYEADSDSRHRFVLAAALD